MKPPSPAHLVPLLLLACCGKAPAPSSVAQAGSARPASEAPKAPPRCADGASVRAHFGQVCAVVGTYRIEDIPLKGGQSLDWPVVVLADGSRVMIESLWDSSKKPDPATVAKLRGKRVEVVGPLHTAPPKESPENFGFPCVSPVQSLGALAE